MVKATVIPTGYNRSLEVPFGDLAIFTQAHVGERFSAGLIDGVADVSYDATGDWYVSDIWLRCGNTGFGRAAKSRLVILDADRDASLYLLVLDAFQARSQERIEALISEALCEAGTAA